MHTIFIKSTGKSLTGSSKRHKNKERRKIMSTQHGSLWERCIHIAGIYAKIGHAPPRSKINRSSTAELN